MEQDPAAASRGWVAAENIALPAVPCLAQGASRLSEKLAPKFSTLFCFARGCIVPGSLGKGEMALGRPSTRQGTAEE